MASKSQFQIGAVKAARKRVDEDKTWTLLEGRVYGPLSNYPLKILIGTGGKVWNKHWVRGCQKYAKKLSSSERRQFALNCQNPATMDPDAAAMASRAAIKGSEALHAVAWCGPIFEDKVELEAWAGGESWTLVLADSTEVEIEAPEDIVDYYSETEDGEWAIRNQREPPADFIASDSEVFSLKADDEFLIQVGSARRVLEEEGVTAEEDDLGNSGGGARSTSAGKRSRKKKERASKS